MSEMVSLVNELKEIGIEIKNRVNDITKLRKRKEKIENTILKYLEDEEKSGIKHGSTILVSEEKMARTRKKKVDKNKDCINILKQYGISNAERIYNEIQEALKGEEASKKILKIKKPQ